LYTYSLHMKPKSIHIFEP